MSKWIVPLRIFGYVVVVLMAVAMAYAGYVALTYWSGIAV